jgi:predicted DNA-binding transcriptional regulator YafY
MAINQYSLLRQWHMLRLVPRAPAKITVRELRDRLLREEFEVTERTVQRDLNELAHVFPLCVDARDKPFGWSWQRDATSFDLPGLSTPEALTLALAEQYLRHVLPPATIDALQPHFQSAARTLSATQGQAPSRSWLDKIRTVQPMQPLLAPRMDAACQRTVYEALMQERQLKLRYRKQDAAEPSEYPVVHPLAIIQRGPLLYLACLFADYADVRTIALHRVVGAEMLYEPARKSATFDIDDYIAQGQMEVVTGAPIELDAVFSAVAGKHLYETPLSAGQTLTALPDGRLRLLASVPSTKTLLWWLLGFGDGVEVRAPADLRAQIAATIEKMALAYRPASP